MLWIEKECKPLTYTLKFFQSICTKLEFEQGNILNQRLINTFVLKYFKLDLKYFIVFKVRILNFFIKNELFKIDIDNIFFFVKK